MVNVFAIAAMGLKNRASVFFNFGNPLKFFVGILELLSEFARIISFTFRLFGNVFAGEVLLAIMALLVPYLVPLPFMFLEVFVGFIQAFIFGMLTLVFVALAVTPHEGEEAGH
jgi:F-type H+-transporting ATPase subunit a